jgi:hypothetical protein
MWAAPLPPTQQRAEFRTLLIEHISRVVNIESKQCAGKVEVRKRFTH